MSTVIWNKCQGNVWCSFSRVDINHPAFSGVIGVYAIFNNQQWIKIGGGNIREEILKDRLNPELSKYAEAKITWARTTNEKISPYIAFLTERLHPVILENITGIVAEEVNIPER